jgi:hypothetical protein
VLRLPLAVLPPEALEETEFVLHWGSGQLSQIFLKADPSVAKA